MVCVCVGGAILNEERERGILQDQFLTIYNLAIKSPKSPCKVDLMFRISCLLDLHVIRSLFIIHY